MKYHTLFLIGCFLSLASPAQVIPNVFERQLENTANEAGDTGDDDNYTQELEQFIKHPVCVNTASTEELRQLLFISDLQIDNLLAWRKQMGDLISIYELQAIPGWDIGTIQKLMPFISTENFRQDKKELLQRFKNGEHSLVIRLSRQLELSKGYKNAPGPSRYTGDPLKIMLRYKYTYKNQLQYGIVADKDAGEKFFGSQQRYGFDFYSAHLFIRKSGMVQALVIGDYTVNLGQGLIHWQGPAFGKGGPVLSIKRQSAVLRPYPASGEFFFHRGVGITIRKKKMAGTAFISLRKLSANMETDSVNGSTHFTSFATSGNHRNELEQSDRNKLKQVTYGANLSWHSKKGIIGWNLVQTHFSIPMEKRDEPYNSYAFKGDRCMNIGMDLSYTFKNFHVFGEGALNNNAGKGFLGGLLISVDPAVDLSILYRDISPRYHAIHGNAFTENGVPSNENGFYFGMSIRPQKGWCLDAYVDIYHFPWLKYLVDAPSSGHDVLAELTYTPGKQMELHTRFRMLKKQGNEASRITATIALTGQIKKNWRLQLNYKISSSLSIRVRSEAIWINGRDKEMESGFLSFLDVLYKPMMKPFDFSCRILQFESDSYDSRLYTYENDILYSYSIPAFYDKGMRYYINASYQIGRKTRLWVRWSQTIYSELIKLGSGVDEIAGNRKSELKMQVRRVF